MDREKLKEMYRNASTRKLLGMLKQAQAYETQSDILSRKSSSIIENLVNTLKEKFPKKDDENEYVKDIGSQQITKMDKQWRIVAASMVKVKRSVKLHNFYQGINSHNLNLYCNSKYGIKEHKRYSGWSPFGYMNILSSAENEEKPFDMDVNKLIIEGQGELKFASLDIIPQLDYDRVQLLKRITQETVWMVDSWRNFYKKLDPKRIARIKRIRGMNNYSVDENELKNDLKDMAQLMSFDKQLDRRIALQESKWKPTVKKWKEHNKNFLVLNELRNSELKV